MALFKKTENTVAFLKMGLYGEAGTGKTFTAAQVAKGLALHIEHAGFAKPPVFFIDTERGASWVAPILEEVGVDFSAASTRAFTDLKMAVTEAEKNNAILIVDSISHFWQEIQQTFLAEKSKRFKRTVSKLQFEDFAVLKPMWNNFTSLYLNSQCHVILCGRAGSIYEYQDNDETHKKELITVGTKMAAEKNMSYEPSLNVEMFIERIPGAGKKKRLINKCTVVKDRANKLNGLEFAEPNFLTFLPHIKCLNIGGKDDGIDMKRTSSALFPKTDNDDRSFQRKIVLDETSDLMTSHFPGQKAEEKKAKVDLIRKHFNASWVEIEGRMPLESLRAGYDALHQELEGKPSKYAIPEFDDELPEEGGAPSGLEILARSYEAAQVVDALNSIRNQHKEFIAALSEGDSQKEAEAYGGAVKRILKAAGEAVQQVAAE
jgi:hypothetical protein